MAADINSSLQHLPLEAEGTTRAHVYLTVNCDLRERFPVLTPGGRSGQASSPHTETGVHSRTPQA
jgi:hypothetical protein